MSNELGFLQIQAARLRQMLEKAADDPILAPQLNERLLDIEAEIKSLHHEEGELFSTERLELPRAAFFLRGSGVRGSFGIRPALAGEALIQYERMFTEQALHDERESARVSGRHRRPRGASTPSLLFTGTPRGSFGLEFVPQPTNDDATLSIHADSLRNVAQALLVVGSSDAASLEDRVGKIPPKVLRPLKQFFKILAQYDAELRLAFSDAPSQSLTVEQIQFASGMLERGLREEEIDLSGVFRGLTRESGHFDLKVEGLGVITGYVADGLTEDDLERIALLTNRRCLAHLLKTTIEQVSGEVKSSYLLIDAFEEAISPANPS